MTHFLWRRQVLHRAAAAALPESCGRRFYSAERQVYIVIGYMSEIEPRYLQMNI